MSTVSEPKAAAPSGLRSAAAKEDSASRAADGERTRKILTFRLDRSTREEVRARLTRDGVTLSSVVTRGLREYVSSASGHAATSRARELPDNVVAWLRELRSSGRSESLSSALAELHALGWPLDRLAQALGVSKQAVQARIRRARRQADTAPADAGPADARPADARPADAAPADAGPADAAPADGGGSRGGMATAGAIGAAGVIGLAGAAGLRAAFARRRAPAADARPHLTIRIDDALRAAAHRAAADEGSSLSQVIERILQHYLRRSGEHSK
jgi:antitoxin component of RelBE/YafQ-DinJ toxin-antitoxin module